MSDLAPFVAAALRDKVVTEMHQEITQLRNELQRERRLSQTVAITGPRGTPVYAQALFQDGKYDQSPELWNIPFYNRKEDKDSSPFKTNRTVPTSKITTKSNSAQWAQCTVENLADMEVRIGGICKARLSNCIVEGFVNDVNNNYDRIHQRGTISIWFGGSSGIWLNIEIQPIEKRAFCDLLNFDLGGESFLNTLLHFVEKDTVVWFTEVSFLISYVNEAMDRWRIGNNNQKQDDGDDDVESLEDEGTWHGHQPLNRLQHLRVAEDDDDDDDDDNDDYDDDDEMSA